MTDNSQFPRGAIGGPVDAQLPSIQFSGIMAVGEAPGRDEVAEGIPFVGKAGRLFDRGLETAGIDRRSIVVANPFRFRPENNKISCFFATRQMAAAEDLQINERLPQFGSGYCIIPHDDDVRHLWMIAKKFNPRVIIAMGNTALWALCGRNGGILKAAGTITTTTACGSPVLPTFHPSYVMRQNPKGEGDTFNAFAAHLRLAADIAGT